MKKLLCLLPVLALLAGCQLASESDPANPRAREPLLPPMPPGFIVQPQEQHFSARRVPTAAMSAAVAAPVQGPGLGTIQPISGGFRVDFDGWIGPYDLQYSTNLTNWVTLGSATNETGVTVRLLDVRKEGDRMMFYRLKGL